MVNSPTVWMPLYIGDYLADTQDFSAEEHGAYLLMIMAYWNNRGPIPADRKYFSRITKINNRVVESVYTKLVDRFKVENGLLRHKRIDEELSKAIERKEKQSSRTAAARAARLLKQSSVTDIVTDTVTDTVTVSSSPYSKKERKKVSKKEILANARTKKRVSLEELSVEHIFDWLCQKRAANRYLEHDEVFILEYFKNYCLSKNKKYSDYVAAYQNSFEWKSCQPQVNQKGNKYDQRSKWDIAAENILKQRQVQNNLGMFNDVIESPKKLR